MLAQDLFHGKRCWIVRPTVDARLKLCHTTIVMVVLMQDSNPVPPNDPSSPAASVPPTSSSPVGPPSLLLRQLVQKILRHYIGTFLPQRCTLCDERRWVLAKCHSNFEWWCLQCGISMQDSTHNGLPPSDSVHCGSSRGPSSHCEYSSAS